MRLEKEREGRERRKKDTEEMRKRGKEERRTNIASGRGAHKRTHTHTTWSDKGAASPVAMTTTPAVSYTTRCDARGCVEHWRCKAVAKGRGRG